MKFIAHRGNINGMNPDLENSPNYIEQTIDKGFEVEIDIWKTNNKIYLGHDKPEYEIGLDFLLKHRNHIWCHAKNIYALEYLLKHKLHTFWHQKDDYTITSKGYIWAYPGFIANGILVMPENIINTETMLENKDKIQGICSDYVQQYKELLESK